MLKRILTAASMLVGSTQIVHVINSKGSTTSSTVILNHGLTAEVLYTNSAKIAYGAFTLKRRLKAAKLALQGRLV